CHQYNSAPWTF
nr:immunoglobulin light chain junction region [Macaca mulatta]MOW55838.1 immunoglobulin light chain junction region [Macaca mulatta]